MSIMVKSLLESLGGNAFKIECNKSILKPLQADNISEDYCRWLNDKEVNQFSQRAGKKIDPEGVSEYVKQANNSKDTLLLGIFLHEERRHVGNIQLTYFDRANGIASSSTMLGERDSWGKGIIIDAASALIDFGFQVLKVRKFVMGNIEPNRASTFKSTTLGAKLEGKRIKHFLLEDKYVDVLEFGLFPDGFYERFPELKK